MLPQQSVAWWLSLKEQLLHQPLNARDTVQNRQQTLYRSQPARNERYPAEAPVNKQMRPASIDTAKTPETEAEDQNKQHLTKPPQERALQRGTQATALWALRKARISPVPRLVGEHTQFARNEYVRRQNASRLASAVQPF